MYLSYLGNFDINYIICKNVKFFQKIPFFIEFCEGKEKNLENILKYFEIFDILTWNLQN
jgi:hypothetical protein